MFGFRKPGRAGLRAALLTGAAVAALGAGGLNPGSAAASCGGAAIHGEGSTLQKKAQEIWTGTGWPALCGGGPAVSYEATGSGAGLHAWGADDGVTFKTTDKFTASDDAPTAAQIGNEEAAIGSPIAITPVTSTAIAIVALPPKECLLSHQIGWHNLRLIWLGTIKKWNELLAGTWLAHTPGACNKPIVRVVREDGSGTSYQFKHFLWLLDNGVVPCLPSALAGSKWSELQKNDTTKGAENPNLVWPEQVNCGPGEEVSGLVRGNGGGGVVKAITEANMETEGRIGYAALSDAENGTEEGAKAEILEVQDGGTEETPSGYAAPNVGKNANCAEAEYENTPSGGGGINEDWSEAYGAHPTTSNGTYPICTLTYDIAAKEESRLFGAGVKTTVEEYFLHLINEEAGGGEENLNNNWYSPPPAAVHAAAEEAVAAIE